MAIRWFVTDRRHGNARARGALYKLLKKRKWPHAAAIGEQVHGDRIAIIQSPRDRRLWKGVDGFLTDQPDIPLGIYTADCLSVFVTSRDERVVGVLHAGWRGLAAGILGKAARLMRQKWGIAASQVRVWAGPAIGPCCFEVGWDVARVFPLTRRRKGVKWHVDLRRELQAQVKKRGLQWMRHSDIAHCTHHQKRYHSFRRDGTSHRQVSVILKTR